MSSSEGLFGDPDFLDKLAYFDLVAKQIIAGSRRGERRSARRGGGTLFKDYRNYVPGDDLRYVDWNFYGRLGSLFVKEFEVEESANILMILDRSLSMGFGEPVKLDFAKKVAAALSYIGLTHLDRVEVVLSPGEGEPRRFAGKQQAPALFEHLQRVEARGETDLYSTVRRCLSGGRRPGVAILISDLLDRRGFQPALDLMLHRHVRTFLVQVSSQEEADPTVRGALRLLDSEDGRKLDVQLDDKIAEAYRKSYRLFCARVESFAKKREIGHARVFSDTPFGEAVLSLLRRGGVIR